MTYVKKGKSLSEAEKILRDNIKNYESLIGKRVIFKPREISKGYFYYDATIKKIGDAYFLKYNRPDERILTIPRCNSAGKTLPRSKQLTSVYKKILQNVNNTYKYSHVLHTEIQYPERFDNVKELTEQNIKELLYFGS